MGYNDHRRYPDFSYLSQSGNFDGILDCIIVSHFHLDHCGALPYFTEVCGYSGPIYMTYPTRAIAPLLLEDGRRLTRDPKVTANDIRNCMAKVIPMNCHQSIQVNESITIKAYYAGHVLGAAMIHVAVKDPFGRIETLVYTGDYNMTPDRHLGSAWIDACEPDVLITESTYGDMIRDSKRARERSFLRKVHDCVLKGGKVLIPVFALGRAQELLILIQGYWERMDTLSSSVPVYFSAGLTERANEYYKLFVSWTNENIKKTFVDRNLFDFSQIKTWNPAFSENPGPMVLFSTPGMLHSGTSLDMFKKWCSDPKNMVILPGYCTVGTFGHKVLQGDKVIVHQGKTHHVNLAVENLSFSAHADAKGILQLIQMCKAKNVVLVHGDPRKMTVLKARVKDELGIPCFDPANGVTLRIKTTPSVPMTVSNELWTQHLKHFEVPLTKVYDPTLDSICLDHLGKIDSKILSAYLMLEQDPKSKKGSFSLRTLDEVGLKPKEFTFTIHYNPFHLTSNPLTSQTDIQSLVIDRVYSGLTQELGSLSIPVVKVESIITIGERGSVSIEMGDSLLTVKWTHDKFLATRAIATLQHCLHEPPERVSSNQGGQ